MLSDGIAGTGADGAQPLPAADPADGRGAYPRRRHRRRARCVQRRRLLCTGPRHRASRRRCCPGNRRALLAGHGVFLAAIPEPTASSRDLGGGSLELVEVSDGEVHGSATRFRSACFGSADPGAKASGALAKKSAKALEHDGFRQALKRKRPLYLVGGSWRALGRLDMLLTAISAADHAPLLDGAGSPARNCRVDQAARQSAT